MTAMGRTRRAMYLGASILAVMAGAAQAQDAAAGAPDATAPAM